MNFYNLFKFGDWDGFPVRQAMIKNKESDLLDIIRYFIVVRGG